MGRVLGGIQFGVLVRVCFGVLLFVGDAADSSLRDWRPGAWGVLFGVLFGVLLDAGDDTGAFCEIDGRARGMKCGVLVQVYFSLSGVFPFGIPKKGILRKHNPHIFIGPLPREDTKPAKRNSSKAWLERSG